MILVIIVMISKYRFIDIAFGYLIFVTFMVNILVKLWTFILDSRLILVLIIDYCHTDYTYLLLSIGNIIILI